MTYVTIPKIEYQQLKKQALTLRRMYARFFDFAIKNPVDEVVADFKATGLYTKGFLRDLEQGLSKSSYAKRAWCMLIKPLRHDLKEYLSRHRLTTKWEKAKLYFEISLRHPSLNVELLEPRWRGIYSFRLDKKYRALFFMDGNQAEVFQITNHYKK